MITGEQRGVTRQRLERWRVLRFLRVHALARFAGDVLHELVATLAVLGAFRDDHGPTACPCGRCIAGMRHGDVRHAVLQVRHVGLDVAEHPVTADHEPELAGEKGVLLGRQVGWRVGADERLGLGDPE